MDLLLRSSGGPLLVILALALHIAIAVQFGNIAEKKGHNPGGWIAWCIFTSLIGYMMVIALPDRGTTNSGGNVYQNYVKSKASFDTPMDIPSRHI